MAVGGELLEVDDLSVSLPTDDGWVEVLDRVTFSVRAGEFVGLAGESGSGKTMSALSILQLLPSRRAKVSGSITFKGIDLLHLSRAKVRQLRAAEIAFVSQDAMSALHPAITVGNQIAETIRAHESVSKKAARQRAIELLGLVGIPEPQRRAGQLSYEFSGGMQQRVAIAMALSCQPSLLIADEPTTALDVTVQAQITELLASLQQELEMAVLFVSHDLGLLAGICHRLIVMYAGQVVEQASVDQLFETPQHPYTEALLLSAPHPEMKGLRLPAIPGSPPFAGLFPNGCRFHPRCKYALPACAAHDIPVTDLGDRRVVRCIRHGELDLELDLQVHIEAAASDA
ncbi:MAG: oligopeptide/dipeptide transporter ATPase [Actinomycetia bacterium]|nr:oligopeptide/dipeptide transporter ATPase [Actinomycetes bacterium]